MVMLSKIPRRENRTREQIEKQYLIEKELAGRLRCANKNERESLYSQVYDEYFRRVPHNPQALRQLKPAAVEEKVTRELRILRRFLYPTLNFLEVGSGDCNLSLVITKFVQNVYAIDVSEEIAKNRSSPKNFKFILSDGCSIPLASNTVDLAYSNQLMEHLHPEDAFDQLRNICDVLTPGGQYICITPHKFSGPHDISKYFDDVATGFHLEEYTYIALANIFESAGFSKVHALVGLRGFCFSTPLFWLKWLEGILEKFPFKLCRQISRVLPIRLVLGIKLVGVK